MARPERSTPAVDEVEPPVARVALHTSPAPEPPEPGPAVAVQTQETPRTPLSDATQSTLRERLGIASNPGNLPTGTTERHKAQRRAFWEAVIEPGITRVRRDFRWQEIDVDGCVKPRRFG